MTALGRLFLALLLLVIVAALVPLGHIWALNTLFGTAIPFDFLHWLAALWFIIFVIGAVRRTGGER